MPTIKLNRAIAYSTTSTEIKLRHSRSFSIIQLTTDDRHIVKRGNALPVGCPGRFNALVVDEDAVIAVNRLHTHGDIVSS